MDRLFGSLYYVRRNEQLLQGKGNKCFEKNGGPTLCGVSPPSVDCVKTESFERRVGLAQPLTIVALK